MASQCSSWSDLPQDILESIFDCVKDPIHIVRCGAACKSWLPTTLQLYRKLLRLCFILDGKDEGSARVLFNLLTKETRMIQVPEAKEKWVFGVCNSWLFLLDSKFPYRTQLLNVLSQTQIDLPPLFSSLPNLSSCNFKWKLLLSKCPLNSDCVLFLLHGAFNVFHKMLFWRPGQNDWSAAEIKGSRNRIDDAILYKGNFYATIINDSTNRTFLVTYNYQLELEEEVFITEIFQEFFYQLTFLVKSFKDDCLLVGVCDYDGKSIEIFEFDVRTKELKKVNDLSGCALFLGTNNFLAKAVHLKTWFKANCIYHFKSWESSDYSVYDLQTRNFSDVPCQFVG